LGDGNPLSSASHATGGAVGVVQVDFNSAKETSTSKSAAMFQILFQNGAGIP
jgi:hypothetical protein